MHTQPRDGLAWVVAWRSVPSDQRVSTRADRTQAEAVEAASELRGLGVDVVSVDERPDLSRDEVWEVFTGRFGPEVRPGVFYPDGHDDLQLLADREVVLRRAYMPDDISDDADLDSVPASPHPRRLGLAWLLSEVEDALAELEGGRQLVLR